MKNITCLLAAVLAAGVFAMPEGFTDDWNAALKRAEKENKTVLALFTGSDWCIWCQRLEGEVFSKKEFSAEVVKDFVPVFLDFPRNQSLVKPAVLKRNRELAEKYGIQGYPTVLLLDAKGEVIGRTGYQAGGPVKYMADLRALPAKGKLLERHVGVYTKRAQTIMQGFVKELSEAASKSVGGDPDKAATEAAKKAAGPCREKIEKILAEVKAVKVPSSISEEVSGLIEQLSGLVENLKKAEKGELQ